MSKTKIIRQGTLNLGEIDYSWKLEESNKKWTFSVVKVKDKKESEIHSEDYKDKPIWIKLPAYFRRLSMNDYLENEDGEKEEEAKKK